MTHDKEYVDARTRWAHARHLDERSHMVIQTIRLWGRRPWLWVVIYLAAIVAANLLVARFGPGITIVNAFLLIGLDLTARDRLHDAWQHQLTRNMGLLIAAGGLLSWLLNRDAGRIALASTVAFVVAALTDALIYQRVRARRWLERVNLSNLGGAAVDSILFPTIAFGSLLPLIVLGQFAAKVLGGFAWSLVLRDAAARR